MGAAAWVIVVVVALFAGTFLLVGFLLLLAVVRVVGVGLRGVSERGVKMGGREGGREGEREGGRGEAQQDHQAMGEHRPRIRAGRDGRDITIVEGRTEI
jgi:hypothetical protein